MGAARSIGVLTILNLIGAVIGVVNSVVVAYFFGTSRLVEIFFASSALQACVTRLAQTGQIAEIFLPIYHRVKHTQGVEKAHRAFSIILNWMMIVAAVLAVAMFFLSSLLMRLRVPGFSESDLALGAQMFRVLILVACSRIVIALFRTLAEAERWFGMAEAVGVLSRLLIVGAIVALASSIGVWSLVIAMCLGNLFMLVGLVTLVVRRGFRYHFCLRDEGFRAWSVFRKTFATMGYVGATQVYLFALDAGLSTLPQGVFAAFRYAQTLYDKTSSVLLRPISVVFFTHFSEAVARGATALRELARSALAGSLAVSSLIIVAMWVAAKPLLGGLWGLERFGVEQMNLAAFLVMLLYMLCLPMALGQLARKTGVSLGLVTSQYFLASLVQLLSGLMVWLLMWQFAVTGAIVGVMAAATLLNLSYLVPLMLWKREFLLFYDLRLLVRWAIAGAVAVAVGRILAGITGSHLVTSRWGMLAVGVALATVSAMVAMGVAWALRVYEVREGARRAWAFARRSRSSIPER